MKFEKGQSGNPAGRPPGSRNKATILAEAMFQAETIIRMAIDNSPVYVPCCSSAASRTSDEHRIS
jgi:hypothetical protein